MSGLFGEELEKERKRRNRMTEKRITRIKAGDGNSLDVLCLKPGDIVGFGFKGDPKIYPPFIITKVGEKGLIKEEPPIHFNTREKDRLFLKYHPKLGKEESYTLSVDGGVLKFLPPKELCPEIIKLQIREYKPRDYVLNSACVGKEEIRKALSEIPELELYSKILDHIITS